MIFNKSYLTAFSKNKPFLALASKGKIIDSKFTLSSELSLYNYEKNIHFPAIQTDSEYCKIQWCEKNNLQILACGLTNGKLALYEPKKEDENKEEVSFNLIKNFDGLTDKVLGLDYNANKNVIAAGSSKGNIIFWNLDKIDQQYKCDILIQENITSLAWNNKVSRILCAGTECGKILILDIRAKNIAMTLQNKDIKTINNLKWHPQCSTSIFASTNLSQLVCFKLDSNSYTQIGAFNSSTLNLRNIDNKTIVCYSEDVTNYVDMDSLTIKDSIKTENVFDMSFSQKDPIYCCSYNSGTTEIFTKIPRDCTEKNIHVQLNRNILGKQNVKIKKDNLKINNEENIQQKLVNILYRDKKYNFDDKIKNELGDFFLHNEVELKKMEPKVCTEGVVVDLNDPLVVSLITGKFKNDLEEEKDLYKDKSISLRFCLDLILNNANMQTNTSLDLLLYLLVSKNYSNFWKKISSEQWPIMIAILMYSELPNNQILEEIRNINSFFQIPFLHMLLNEPNLYYNSSGSQLNLPTTVFEVRSYFEQLGKEIFDLKKLDIQYDSSLLNEYFWFAKDYGKFEELNDIKYNDRAINEFIGKSETTYKPTNFVKNDVLPDLNNLKISLDKTIPNTKNTENVFTSNPSQGLRPPLYSGNVNRSVTAFSTKPMQKVEINDSNPGILKKPILPKKTLYSGVLNKSATSINSRLDPLVSTYGQEKASNPIKTPMPGIPSPKIPTIPTFQSKPTIPQPASQKVVPDLPQEDKQQPGYDVDEILSSFERIFEEYKLKASKKHNLIVGNKIKDATRRFMIFKQIEKSQLSTFILQKMCEIVNVLKTEADNNTLKFNVRSIIDECYEYKSCESDIWLPAIGILVQLI